MSPEQGHGQAIDERSDLYSLGVMTYEMLVGAKPFDAPNPMAILFHHAKTPIPRLPEHLAAAQPAIDALMAKSPSDRPASGAAAAAMLAVAIDGLGAEEAAA
jgi:serine/threonine protein kinase